MHLRSGLTQLYFQAILDIQLTCMNLYSLSLKTGSHVLELVQDTA